MNIKQQPKGAIRQGFIEAIRKDFRLRQELLQVRYAEFNSQVKSSHKLGIGPTIYLSAFITFNMSLLSLYLSVKSAQKRAFLNIPIIFSCFMILAYKLEIQWTSRQIIRKSQSNTSDIAYLLRKKLLSEFKEHLFVKSRRAILQARNKEYQKLYLIENS